MQQRQISEEEKENNPRMKFHLIDQLCGTPSLSTEEIESTEYDRMNRSAEYGMTDG